MTDGKLFIRKSLYFYPVIPYQCEITCSNKFYENIQK